MTDSRGTNEVSAYRRAIAQTLATGQATEHSYRPDLQTLIQALGGPGIRAINEPSHVACGAPDFIVERRGIPIGHVECKNVGANLDDVENDEQLTRYRKGLPNLILTDYLEFRWYVQGELRQIVRLGRPNTTGGISADRGGSAQVGEILGAFFKADAPAVADPRELAERMAAKTRLLRDGIQRILGQDDRSGPFQGLLTAYRDVLIADLSEDAFADMQAQTAAYGLFAARCMHRSDSGPFNRQSAAFSETTPFLREVFGQIAGPNIDRRIAWIVDDLALLLDRADMASILQDFGRRTRREDPVVHFYEDFLAAYDPELREVRGIYFTPEPVVSYIVRSVDRLLRDRFGLADGLAQTTAGISDARPLLILDPAAGTGSFLREVILRIRSTINSKGMSGAWPDYVRNHLLPRLFGFELLMAPYAICHLKLALEISGADAGFTMPESQRLGVFLTNALEQAHEQGAGPLFAPEIRREATSADAIKQKEPVMVVIGNPPYSGHSANKGRWIADLLRGMDGGIKTGNYFRVDGQPLGERNPKWVNNDYVKFIRFAQWRIEQTGKGIVGFITDHGWLSNSTFRGMRESLIDVFDDIYILDLHGNSNRKEHAPDGSRDENVFDIKQGVAIVLFVKGLNKGDKISQVWHADLWGERTATMGGGKYGWLSSNDVGSTEWVKLQPRTPKYMFVPHEIDLEDEWNYGISLSNIFSKNSVGIVTAHDRVAVKMSEEDINDVVRSFRNLNVTNIREELKLNAKWSDEKIERMKQDILDHSDSRNYITRMLYRPFDFRYTWYSGRVSGFLGRPRSGIMRHMLSGNNVGLIAPKRVEHMGGWQHISITNCISGHVAVSLKTIDYLFPLYDAVTKRPNLSGEFIKLVQKHLKLRFTADTPGDLEETVGPEAIFDYIFSVLHSSEYRVRYAEFLKLDFPRVPLTGDRGLFATLVGLGKRLVALHLMQTDGVNLPAFPRTGSNRVVQARYAPPGPDGPGRVWINADQYFEGIDPDTWAFAIGGYRPAEKWLKDRRKRLLSFDDIVHYRRICGALDETRQIMADIDATIQRHGGWPLARPE